MRNPAHAMPALRRHLTQLLGDMNHAPESRQREGMPRMQPALALRQHELCRFQTATLSRH